MNEAIHGDTSSFSEAVDVQLRNPPLDTSNSGLLEQNLDVIEEQVYEEPPEDLPQNEVTPQLLDSSDKYSNLRKVSPKTSSKKRMPRKRRSDDQLPKV